MKDSKIELEKDAQHKWKKVTCKDYIIVIQLLESCTINFSQ